MSSTKRFLETSDIISLFREAEEEISHEHGDFTLFGLFERTDIFGKYDCVVSAPWLKDELASINLIFDLVHASIGHDRWFRNIGIFMTVPQNGPFVAAVRESLPNGSIQHGMKRLTNFFYDGEIIRDAVIITLVEATTKDAVQAGKRSEPVAV